MLKDWLRELKSNDNGVAGLGSRRLEAGLIGRRARVPVNQRFMVDVDGTAVEVLNQVLSAVDCARRR